MKNEEMKMSRFHKNDRFCIRVARRLAAFALLCLLIVPASAQDKRYHGDGIDNVLRFVPVAAVYGLKVAGVESASSWKRLAVNTVASYALVAGSTWGLKQTIHQRRPDGSNRHGFPSGHTSLAFASATILHEEYFRRSPWISVGGYAVATMVAVDRVRRDRHEWGDVCAGAAIGVGGTMLGYWIGDKITGERSRYSVAVSPNGVTVAMNL